DLTADPTRVLHRLAVFLDAPVVDNAKFDFIDGHDVDVRLSHTVSGNPMRFGATTMRIQSDTSWTRDMSPRDQRLVSAMAALMPSGRVRRSAHAEQPAAVVHAPEVAPRAPDRPWPSVSAVISTRDRPQLLERAIESIAAQDYPGELEIVVVFD